MKLKLSKLYDSRIALNILLSKLYDDNETSLGLAENINTINEKLNIYYGFEKNIKEQYSDKDDQGKSIVINEKYQMNQENKIKAQNELETFLNQDIELDIQLLKRSTVLNAKDIVDVKNETTGKIEKLKKVCDLSPAVLASILWLLEPKEVAMPLCDEVEEDDDAEYDDAEEVIEDDVEKFTENDSCEETDRTEG